MGGERGGGKEDGVLHKNQGGGAILDIRTRKERARQASALVLQSHHHHCYNRKKKRERTTKTMDSRRRHLAHRSRRSNRESYEWKRHESSKRDQLTNRSIYHERGLQILGSSAKYITNTKKDLWIIRHHIDREIIDKYLKTVDEKEVRVFWVKVEEPVELRLERRRRGLLRGGRRSPPRPVVVVSDYEPFYDSVNYQKVLTLEKTYNILFDSTDCLSLCVDMNTVLPEQGPEFMHRVLYEYLKQHISITLLKRSTIVYALNLLHDRHYRRLYGKAPNLFAVADTATPRSKMYSMKDKEAILRAAQSTMLGNKNLHDPFVMLYGQGRSASQDSRTVSKSHRQHVKRIKQELGTPADCEELMRSNKVDVSVLMHDVYKVESAAKLQDALQRYLGGRIDSRLLRDSTYVDPYDNTAATETLLPASPVTCSCRFCELEKNEEESAQYDWLGPSKSRDATDDNDDAGDKTSDEDDDDASTDDTSTEDTDEVEEMLADSTIDWKMWEECLG